MVPRIQGEISTMNAVLSLHRASSSRAAFSRCLLARPKSFADYYAHNAMCCRDLDESEFIRQQAEEARDFAADLQKSPAYPVVLSAAAAHLAGYCTPVSDFKMADEMASPADDFAAQQAARMPRAALMQTFRDLAGADAAANGKPILHVNSGMDRLYIVLDGNVDDMKRTEVALLAPCEERKRHVAAGHLMLEHLDRLGKLPPREQSVFLAFDIASVAARKPRIFALADGIERLAEMTHDVELVE